MFFPPASLTSRCISSRLSNYSLLIPRLIDTTFLTFLLSLLPACVVLCKAWLFCFDPVVLQIRSARSVPSTFLAFIHLCDITIQFASLDIY